jgi:hypothetical protein
MNSINLPFIGEISKIQEQMLLPVFIKLSRMQEQLWVNMGGESTADIKSGFLEVYKRCQDYTLTPFKAMYAIYEAASYVAKARIAGDFVECGVWKGGSSMIAALAFLQHNSPDRKLYLYDTYEGMPDFADNDGNIEASLSPFQLAMNLTAQIRGSNAGILYAPLEDVRRNMQSTGYPEENIFFVKGMIEDTIPAQAPEQISLLHLDSDLYQSTYHELVHLYPRLTKGGVLLIDDYGSWKGSKKATDQYFEEHGISMLLASVGAGGAHMGIKT